MVRTCLIILALLVGACGDSTAREETVSDSSPDAPEIAGPVGEDGAVSRASFEAAGLLWPLTVDEGRIGCTALAAWIEVGGVEYGLNGFASEEAGYRDLEPIWAADDSIMRELEAAGVEGGVPLKVNLGDMLSEANRLCD